MSFITDKKRSIGDVSKELLIPQHVIRFWETQFPDYIKPIIGTGSRRYFYDKDIKILKTIKYYLYDKGYTIKGLQNLLLKENLDTNIPEVNNIIKKEITCDNINDKIKINDSMKNINTSSLNNINLKNDLKNFKSKLNLFYDKLKNI